MKYSQKIKDAIAQGYVSNEDIIFLIQRLQVKNPSDFALLHLLIEAYNKDLENENLISDKLFLRLFISAIDFFEDNDFLEDSEKSIINEIYYNSAQYFSN